MLPAKRQSWQSKANLQLIQAPVYLDEKRVVEELLRSGEAPTDKQVLVCSGSLHRSVEGIRLPSYCNVCQLHDAVLSQLGCLGKERMRQELVGLVKPAGEETDDELLQAVKEGAHSELPALATRLIRSGGLSACPWRHLIVLDGHDLSENAMEWLVELGSLDIDVWVIYDPLLMAITSEVGKGVWSEVKDRCPVSAFMHAENLSRKVVSAIDGLAKLYGCDYRPQAGFSAKGSHEVRAYNDVEAECDGIAEFIHDCDSLTGRRHSARVFGLYHNKPNGLESRLIIRLGAIPLSRRSLFFERTGRLLLAIARIVKSRDFESLLEAVRLVGFDANVVSQLRALGASTDPTCLTSEIVEMLPDNRARRVCKEVLTLLTGVGVMMNKPDIETAVEWLKTSKLSCVSSMRIEGLAPLARNEKDLSWLVDTYDECMRLTNDETPLVSYYPERPAESKYTWVTLQGLPATNQDELARQVYVALAGAKGGIVIAGQWSRNHTLYRLLETSGFIAS